MSLPNYKEMRTKESAFKCGYNACLADLAARGNLPTVEYRDLDVWRARFAGLAMQGLLSSSHIVNTQSLATLSVKCADDLIKELTK